MSEFNPVRGRALRFFGAEAKSEIEEIVGVATRNERGLGLLSDDLERFLSERVQATNGDPTAVLRLVGVAFLAGQKHGRRSPT